MPCRFNSNLKSTVCERWPIVKYEEDSWLTLRMYNVKRKNLGTFLIALLYYCTPPHFHVSKPYLLCLGKNMALILFFNGVEWYFHFRNCRIKRYSHFRIYTYVRRHVFTAAIFNGEYTLYKVVRTGIVSDNPGNALYTRLRERIKPCMNYQGCHSFFRRL